MKLIEIKDLEKKQEAIEQEICRIAEENRLSNEGIEPIYDGVGDLEQFLISTLNTTVILKEPYDSKDEDGNPLGGGWSLVRDSFMKNVKWPVLTWQRIIYIMYGVKNNLYWKTMDYIRDNPEMGKVLRELPWINLSKMPYQTQSKTNRVESEYNNFWKPIVKDQIDLYNSKILLFGGTFNICRNDFISNDVPPMKTIELDNRSSIEVYESKGRILLNAPHPGFMYKRVEYIERYINNLIDIIDKYRK